MVITKQNPTHIQSSIMYDNVWHRVVSCDHIFVDLQVFVLLHREPKVLGGRIGDGYGDGKGSQHEMEYDELHFWGGKA
jgi:hypothetical protein